MIKKFEISLSTDFLKFQLQLKVIFYKEKNRDDISKKNFINYPKILSHELDLQSKKDQI